MPGEQAEHHAIVCGGEMTGRGPFQRRGSSKAFPSGGTTGRRENAFAPFVVRNSRLVTGAFYPSRQITVASPSRKMEATASARKGVTEVFFGFALAQQNVDKSSSVGRIESRGCLP
jgi:hypothetical protein